MIHLEPNHRIDFVHDLLISVIIKLIIIKADYYLRVISIHSFIDSCVDLQVECLDILIQHDILLEFG